MLRPVVKNSIRSALWFLAGLLVAIGITSYSQPESDLRMKVGFGECRFGKSPDGMWWQSDHENASQYKDHCGEIGISGKLNPVFGWNLRYVNLGMARTRALAVTFPDDDGSKRDPSKDIHRAECQSAMNGDNCLYKWDGAGTPGKGLAFTIDREFLTWGPVKAFAEVGAFIYHLSWSEVVHRTDCHDGDCPGRVTVDQRSGYYLSPVVGGEIQFALTKRSSLYAAMRFYLRTTQHTPVTAGVSGPVEQTSFGLITSF